MGCFSVKEDVLPLIPEPQGEAKDPLSKQGDLIQNIAEDPHINYYQKQISQILVPLRRKKGKIKNMQEIEKFATTQRTQHQKYVDSINEAIKGNSITTTNILSYMVNQIADQRDKKKLEKFQGDQYAALKCFVYLYTGNYSYKKISESLRKSEYDKISKVIGVIKQQLQKFNKEQFARKLKANTKFGKFVDLYRGISKPDLLMSKGRKLFWKSFTSTTLQRKVASKFGRYHYVIELDQESPHDYMIVEPQLSQFDEEEVILFPYFYFECDNVEDFTSGANYLVKQAMLPPQI